LQRRTRRRETLPAKTDGEMEEIFKCLNYDEEKERVDLIYNHISNFMRIIGKTSDDHNLRRNHGSSCA
jgi:hypothetical protein